MQNLGAAVGSSEVSFVQSKIVCQNEKIGENARFVFGITHYAFVEKISCDAMKEKALALVGDAKSFRISVSRLLKEGKTSQELNEEIGAFVFTQKPGIKVKLVDPEVEVFFDIVKDAAYVYTKKEKALGGLPVGVSGDVFLEVTDPERATVAGFLMLKRGCNVAVSKALPLLKKFEHGFAIEVRPRKREEVLVNDLMFEGLDMGQKTETVLMPLAGLGKNEVDDWYNKIEKL